jgi:transcriptional regulator with XRE-family HTH domain
MEKSIYSEDYALFLQLLRDVRTKVGITQEELAERLKQTQSFISKVERGERRLDIVELMAFCKALGISFQYFVTQFEKLLNTKGDKS